MKNSNKQILEAINRGIQLALDGFEDQDDILQQTHGKIKNNYNTKEYVDLMNIAVDLELPSGTWWCKYNLGVNPNQLNKPEDWFGDYYAWGETTTNRAKAYDWNTYKFGFPGAISKYNEKDNLKQLQPEDDVATQLINIYGFNASIPTEEQFEELLKYTTNEWVVNYKESGINGKLFTSTINKNQIFMPAAGSVGDHGGIIDGNYCGKYWSSTHNQTYSYYHAYFLRFSEFSCIISDNQRANGFTIRPIVNLK